MTALNNRMHTFAHPDIKNQLTKFYTGVLGCELLMMREKSNN